MLLQLRANVTKNKKWHTVYEIINLITSVVDSQHLFQLIIQKVTEVLGAKSGSLMLLDDMTQTLTIAFAYGLPKEIIQSTRIQLGEGIAGHVAQTGEPLRIANITKAPQFAHFKRERYETKSLLCVPLKIGNRILGVINITTKLTEKLKVTPSAGKKKAARSFSESDLEILTAIANASAIAIENARLVERLQYRVNEVSILYLLAVRLVEKNSPSKVFEVLTQETQKMVPFDNAIYFTYQKQLEKLHVAEVSGLDTSILHTFIPLDMNNVDRIRTGTDEDNSLLIKEILSEHLFFPQDKLVSLFAAPLWIENELFGVLAFGAERAQGFTVPEQQLLKIVSANAAHILYHFTQMITQSQLASMGELVASIAHDLKSPLWLVLENLATLQKEIPENEQQQFADIYKITKQETFRAIELVNQLLRFSNPEEFTRKYCDVQELLRQVVRLVENQAKRKKITIKTEFADTVPLLWVHPNQIQEAALNLVSNAFDAMPDGGILTISTRLFTGNQTSLRLRQVNSPMMPTCLREAETIADWSINQIAERNPKSEIRLLPATGKGESDASLRYRQAADSSIPGGFSEREPGIGNGQYLQIAFLDTGKGISPVHMKKIFSRFFTTKINGTGLGLMITEKIIKGMGGFITVESQENKGTGFYLHLLIPETQK